MIKVGDSLIARSPLEIKEGTKYPKDYRMSNIEVAMLMTTRIKKIMYVKSKV